MSKFGNINEILAERHPQLYVPKVLKDGKNVIYKGGAKLVAFGFEGRVVDWIGYDAEGNQVPTVVIREPYAEEKFEDKDKPTGTRYQVCVCLTGPEETCWWMECICGRCASLT